VSEAGADQDRPHLPGDLNLIDEAGQRGMKRNDALVSVGVALCWGCVVAVGVYAVVRAVQFFLYPDPNPTTLVWSAHAGFFWRCWTCAYAGGIAAFTAYLVTRSRPDRSIGALGPAVAVVAALLALQVTLMP
jgi:hypothetical protein